MRQSYKEWLPTSEEAFFIPLILCYAFFFMLEGKLFWLSLTMPFIVLLLNIAFITLNFLCDKNTTAVMRQSATLVVAFLPLIISCIKL